MIDSLHYAKLPQHLKRSLNLAYLEKGTYDQIVAHLERHFELRGLEKDAIFHSLGIFKHPCDYSFFSDSRTFRNGY